MIEAERKLVSKMWSELPPKVFEKAPSSSGLFEREEIKNMGNIVAEKVEPFGANFLFLGSATAFREFEVMRRAKKLNGQMLHINHVTAVDIAPQLLKVAERRMRLLKQFGAVESYNALLQSVEEIPLNGSIKDCGIAIMGVYDLACLIGFGQERNGEPVGLNEYGEGMKNILGPHTRILPLRFNDRTFYIGDPIISYRSPVDYEGVRNNLQEYCNKNKDIIGLRVQISNQDYEKLILNGKDKSSLFVSTWFNLGKLVKVFDKFNLNCSLSKVSARKGAVLVVSGDYFGTAEKSKNCALVMNNVVGNLATAEIMTNFFSILQRFCKGDQDEK